MLEVWRKRRNLEKEVQNLKEEITNAEKRRDTEDIEVLSHERESKEMWIDSIDTNKLVRNLVKRGIDPPREKASWWYTDSHWDLNPAEAPEYLTPVGKAGAAKLIREDRRANVEFWMKVLTPMLTVATGLTAAIVGLVAAFLAALKDIPCVPPP